MPGYNQAVGGIGTGGTGLSGGSEGGFPGVGGVVPVGGGGGLVVEGLVPFGCLVPLVEGVVPMVGGPVVGGSVPVVGGSVPLGGRVVVRFTIGGLVIPVLLSVLLVVPGGTNVPMMGVIVELSEGSVVDGLSPSPVSGPMAPGFWTARLESESPSTVSASTTK